MNDMPAANGGTRTAIRTCPLCEATCGLALDTDGERVTRTRGDRLHPASRGHLCPKASGLAWLHDDPDRIRQPMVRSGSTWTAVGWDDAFGVIEERLGAIVSAHGLESVATYVGNPGAYSLAQQLYGPSVVRHVRNRFTPGPVDTFPKQMATGLMYGGEFTMPVPDVDRTALLWVVGANPAESNGSLCVAPDFSGRIAAIRARGGRVVVIDPRRTRTAALADEHHFIRPATDAAFLAAVAHVLFADGLVSLGRLGPHVAGLDALRGGVAPFTPERVAAGCGIAPQTIRRLAHDLAAAPTAAIYGRLGTCTQQFGTAACWLLEVLSTLTGNLDNPGGTMFAWPYTGAPFTRPGSPQLPRTGRWMSRVRGHPEVMGELPVSCLADDVLDPGPGRIRALLTMAGNPALSVPDARIADALDALEFHVAIDVYRNETTSRAHVLLPDESHLQRPHVPLSQHLFMLQQVAVWSDPVFAPDPDRPRDWEVLLRLGAIVAGQGARADVAKIDDEQFHARVALEVRRPASPCFGREIDDVLAACTGTGPERIIDFMIRVGPYGDGFGTDPAGLTLATVKAAPHGLVVAEPEPRVPAVLRTPSGNIELAPPVLLAELRLVLASLDELDDTLLLIGRRDMRSNNSWMHNLPGLMRGKDRSQLLVHPTDAQARGIADGDLVRVVGAVAAVEVIAGLDDAMMPGTVSLPHGWGHNANGAQLRVAAQHPGVNCNVLADHDRLDAVSGASVVNGIRVDVRRAAQLPGVIEHC